MGDKNNNCTRIFNHVLIMLFTIFASKRVVDDDDEKRIFITPCWVLYFMKSFCDLQLELIILAVSRTALYHRIRKIFREREREHQEINNPLFNLFLYQFSSCVVCSFTVGQASNKQAKGSTHII